MKKKKVMGVLLALKIKVEEPSKDASSLPGYPSGRGGGRKTKRRRAKRTIKRKIPTNTVENIWEKIKN